MFGQNLLEQMPPINPFMPPPALNAEGTPNTMPPPTAASAGAPAGTRVPPPSVPTEQHTERLSGWKNFFNRVKTDPDMKLAMMQFFIGLSQPAPNPAAGVGQGMQAAVQTLSGLKDQRRQQGREDQQDSRANRQVAVAEGSLANENRRMGMQGSQFDESMGLQRDELAAHLEQIRGDNAYKQGLLGVERTKAANGGEQGQVNARWSRLTDLIMKVRPELAQGKRENAEAYAWDLMNGDQSRAALKAKLINDQMLFLPDPVKNKEKYDAAFAQLSAQTDSILDSAGLGNERLFQPPNPGIPLPGGTPGSGGPSASGVIDRPGQPPAAAAPARPQLAPGVDISLKIQGKPTQAKIIAVTPETVTVDIPGLGQKTLKRALLEGALGGQP